MQTNQNKMNPRHSSLPKLALCGQYEGTPGTASEAAQRGTMLDAAFRQAWETSEFPELAEDDAVAVRWAINQCSILTRGGATLKIHEADCKSRNTLMQHEGTADGVSRNGKFHVDLKSGQIYDYEAQMAAYALGFMEEQFESQWTAYLLFCDQQRVVTHHFTYESAKAIVAGVLANIGTAPKQNEYCAWCSKSLTCPARVESYTAALVPAQSGITVQDQGFLDLLNDPERLGKFLTACSTLEDFRDAAKAKSRELLEAKQEVPGWRLQKPRATAYVEAESIVWAFEEGQIGGADAIRALGSISAKKAEALWSAAGHQLPERFIIQKIGQAPLVASK
jgi:hypothetical protein